MRFRNSLLFIAVLGLFVAGVMLKWVKGANAEGLIGGLLPWRDARGHFYGSLYLLQYGIADEWTTRRVLSVAYDATRAMLTGRNLQIGLILQALLTGAACFLAARAITRSHGPVAGFVMLLLTASFALPYLPTTLTETVGLMFGALSFALLWQGIHERRPAVCGLAIALLSIGLSIRPGPILLLPAAMAAGWIALGPTAGRWRAAFWLGLGAGAALAANIAMIHLIGNPDGAPQANMAHALYGLSAGGDWTLVYRDIAGASDMTEHDLVEILHQRIWENLRAHPGVFAETLWQGAILYWRKGLLFGFCWAGAAVPTVMLLAAAILAAIRIRDRGGLLLAILAALGMMAAGPVAVMNGDSRVFAVGIPFAAALLGVALHAVFAAARSPYGLQPALDACRGRGAADRTLRWAEPGFAALLIAMATVIPAARAVLVAPPPLAATQPCPEGLTSLVFDVGAGSPFIRVRSQTGWSAMAPIVSAASFQAGLERHRVEIGDAIGGLKTDTALVEAFALDRRREPRDAPVVVADDRLIPPAGNRVQLCGTEERLNGMLVYRAVMALPASR